MSKIEKIFFAQKHVKSGSRVILHAKNDFLAHFRPIPINSEKILKKIFFWLSGLRYIPLTFCQKPTPNRTQLRVEMSNQNFSSVFGFLIPTYGGTPGHFRDRRPPEHKNFLKKRKFLRNFGIFIKEMAIFS